jgi:hypothetical protein
MDIIGNVGKHVWAIMFAGLLGMFSPNGVAPGVDCFKLFLLSISSIPPIFEYTFSLFQYRQNGSKDIRQLGRKGDI